jgi:hypothetical protein
MYPVGVDEAEEKEGDLGTESRETAVLSRLCQEAALRQGQTRSMMPVARVGRVTTITP